MASLPKALIIGGVTFPVKYKGYNLTRNKIWSANTGRNNLGDMVGTLIKIKTKAEVTLTPMSLEQAGIIDNIISDVSNPFPTAKMLYVDGTQKDITIYTGDVNYNVDGTSINNGKGLVSSVTFSVIEK